ncbi:MAG: hypothetical protein ABI600_16735 [Luteolibacter sp.]
MCGDFDEDRLRAACFAGVDQIIAAERGRRAAGGWIAGFDPAAVLGIFSGASTNTPSLGAATQTLGTIPGIAADRLALPALAYAVTYPPALAFASNIAGSDAPTVGYATVYRLTTLMRILAAQILTIILFQ